MTVRNETPTQSQPSITEEVKIRNASNVSIHFNTNNSDAVQDIARYGRFGKTEEEVVIFALRFLYTVYRNRPDVKELIAEGPSGRTVIDI